MSRRYQISRPNPHKPFVHKSEHGTAIWWAKVQSLEGHFICELGLSWREAFDKALKMAEDAA